MSMLAAIFAPLLAAAVGNGSVGVVPFDGPAPTAVSDADRPVASRAESALEALAAGTLDSSLLAPSFRGQFTTNVAAADRSFLKGRGDPKRFLFLQKNDSGESVRYVFVASWGDGASLAYTFGLNKTSDLVDTLYFRPYTSPGL